MKISKFRGNNLDDSFSKISIFNFFYTIKNNKKIKKDFVVDHAYNLESLMNYANSLKQQKLDFEKLINEFENLSDKEFFYLYKQFYMWDNTEIKKVYHKGLFKNPTCHLLKTDDVTIIEKREGHGRDFSYWYEWYHSKYEIISDSDMTFENRIYTKQELADLVKQNKIIINKTGIPYGQEIDSAKAQLICKQMKKINTNSVELDMNFNRYPSYITLNDIDKMYEKNEPAFKRIREEFTKEILEKDYKKYMIEYVRVKQEIISKSLELKENLKITNENASKNDKMYDIIKNI